MNTKDFILLQARKKGKVRSEEIIKKFGLTRQTAAQHFRELVLRKKLLKIGSTRGAYYVPYSSRQAVKLHQREQFSGWRPTSRLSEDRVLNEAALKLNFRKQLSRQALEIVNYAFTEMLNNAIDHSRAPKVFFLMRWDAENIFFQIRDQGIGVYESIRRKFHFADHHAAVEHLLKGKQSTQPEKHSGEGIFFTSKIADTFLLKSTELTLLIDNGEKDVYLTQNKRFYKGTCVEFSLKKRSRKSLKALFDQYSNEEFEFDKTQVLVRLSEREGNRVSRSEAKRILLGLDKFKRIVFDFTNIAGIGQSFADEIFRVFQGNHPEIQLEVLHAVKAVELMIKRARSIPYN